MELTRKILLALGIFTMAISFLVAAVLLVIMVIFGGQPLASYVAGLFGLGTLAEFIITVAIFMVIPGITVIPAVVVTFLELNN